MSILTEISSLLQHNDLFIKGIATIAAPGGIWFWIDKFRNRIRIKVRKLGLAPGDPSIRGITFEAENVSATLTSFEPKFTLTGYSPERKKQTYAFTIEGSDRQLPSHVSKQFLAWHNHSENRILLFLWFMTFKLTLSRGGCVRIRIRNSQFEQISFLQFHWEKFLFLWLKIVPE
jgi:hypothetical protein